ncbi:MAG TPA: LacI family DNA-binding transcriptional regulator [Chitinophagaceae bacterium]|nr:LacI family DNA-binding transcriptional regulator [Chitinophagaceae bacterium]HQZ73872.1 LacI family DNA-binding transcriptional regulator [Chitinophagaceae bacterium]
MKKNNVTIQSMAKTLGVSVTTISRVLNGLGEQFRISKKTIELVTTTADKLNYRPNNIAKGLRLKKSSTIGLILPDITNTWFAQLALGIEKEARKHHYNIFLCNSNDDIKVEKKSIALLQSWMVDGIIIAPIGLESEHLQKASKSGTPVVLIDRFFEGVNLPYISSNDFEGSLEATQYLINNGHKKIACFQGIVGTSPNNQRVNGYKQALKNNKIHFDPSLVMGEDFGFNNGYTCAKKLIKHLAKSKITAIISMGNQITLGILKALKEEGVQIPNDLSIISFDEQEYSDLLYTPLTTVSHMNENIGDVALKMLFNQFGKSTRIKPKNVVLNSKLIIRDSVKKIGPG